LQQNYKVECPYCAEIIKSQAKVCKHCGKEIKTEG
jgi:rRNA maturation endonuclease Nob1